MQFIFILNLPQYPHLVIYVHNQTSFQNQKKSDNF